jgi:hypothetical protein
MESWSDEDVAKAEAAEQIETLGVEVNPEFWRSVKERARLGSKREQTNPGFFGAWSSRRV